MNASSNCSDLHSKTEPSSRMVFYSALFSLTLVGACLRLYQADESLWLDELHTAWTISGELADLPRRAAWGNYSPYYFYLPWIFCQSLGTSELALRLPSILAGIGLIPLMSLMVYRWSGSQAASLATGALVTMDANFLFYSLEARSYSLVQLVGLSHAWFFWRLLENPNKWFRLGFIAGGVALFYLHYTAVLLLFAECFFYLITIGSMRSIRYSWKMLFFDLFGIFLLCLPAVGHLSEISQRRELWALFVKQHPPSALLTIFPLDLYILLPGSILVVLEFIRRMTKSEKQIRKVNHWQMAWLLSWLFVPLVLAWCSTHLDIARLYFRRYLIVSSLPPILISGVLCGLFVKKWMRIVCGMVIVTAAFWSSGSWNHFQLTGKVVSHSLEDWRAVTRCINDYPTQSHLPVLLYSGLIESSILEDTLDAEFRTELREYCLFPISGIYSVDRNLRQLVPLSPSSSEHLDQEILELVDRNGGAWVIVRGKEKTTAKYCDNLLTGLKKHSIRGRFTYNHSFGQLRVVMISAEEVNKS